jgi:hypothetical protein
MPIFAGMTGGKLTAGTLDYPYYASGRHDSGTGGARGSGFAVIEATECDPKPP